MGLSIRGVDVQTQKIWLDVASGFYDGMEVRGQDVLIPGRPGLYPTAREANRRLIRLEGYVVGQGSTEAERTADWYQSTLDLMAAVDIELMPGNVVITTPYLGLPSGSATIAARTVNLISGPPQSCMSYQTWSIELEAVGNPPDWTFA